MSLCALSRRLSSSTQYARCILPHNALNRRYLSCLSSTKITRSSPTAFTFRPFSTDSPANNNGNSNDSGDGDSKPSTSNTPSILQETNNELYSTRIHNEARNQKSLVKASGKNKSLVPYIGSVLVVPVQKPLFPGFSSMLYIKDENLKIYLIQQFRKRLQAQYNKDNKIENAKDIINSSEWIGLFLQNPKTTPITAEEELRNANQSDHELQRKHSNQTASSVNTAVSENPESKTDEQSESETNAIEVELEMDEKEETKVVWHPALDEVNSDMHHSAEALPTDKDDVFEYGVLAKIDYSDELTNIAEFVKLENEEFAECARKSGLPPLTGSAGTDIFKESPTTSTSTQSPSISAKKKKSKKLQFPVSRWEDPLVLKVISARRIKFQSICEHKPLMTANIQHLQPEIHIKKSDIMALDKAEESLEAAEEHEMDNIEMLNENKHIVNESESEIKTRSAFNVASDLLRRLYADDPDNRREMLQLWSARHHIDIGFFCDFAASITNSTPRELQKLLECVDYGERLALLCRLLKREESMMKKRDEIMNHVDALIKKEDESYYLKMILHTTQRRLMINDRERYIMSNGVNAGSKQYQQQQQQQQQQAREAGGGGGGPEGEQGGEQEKKDRYQRLAAKFKERVKDKVMSHEAKEVFDEGIEKLLNAKNRESLDVETTKQYLDWISSLPWNHYSIDNDNIQRARQILDEDHYGMKLVKERILEVIACNILRGDLNLNEKFAAKQTQKESHEDKDNHDDDDRDNDNMDKKEEVNDSKILCLVGPPGVGKTSIGASIARSLNRKFFKFSLGGSDDSHLLKGFLRTYAGSQPGKIIYGLRQCRTSNPMILIDEIDKMGARHSDPSHALLEILDPSQNHIFSDNYMDFAVDLSKVLFVCTANDESKINPVLRDRLHIIRLSGYDEHEKLEIAKQYLIPNALKKCGLKAENISLSDEVMLELIKWYCRESGVRSLAQHIERICFKAALELAEAGITYKDINHEDELSEDAKSTDDKEANNDINNSTERVNAGKKILDTLSSFVKRIATDKDTDGEQHKNEKSPKKENEAPNNQEIAFVQIDKDNLKKYVGLRRYQKDRTYEDVKSTPCGVVTGLAYTTNGGCITYVETIKYRKNPKSGSGSDAETGGGGGGNLKSTGQLGKVMGESVEIGQCVARALLSNKIDCHNTFFDDYNIHLHCPEGAIQKDGPSAGITMVTALLSLALNQPISPNVAMTGEVTLTGKILKIGGLKEKLLAAKRAHIDTILIPFDNYDDFYDDEHGVPKYLRDEFKDVHFVKHYDEVLHILFSSHLPYLDAVYEKEQEGGSHLDRLHQSPAMPKPL